MLSPDKKQKKMENRLNEKKVLIIVVLLGTLVFMGTGLKAETKMGIKGGSNFSRVSFDPNPVDMVFQETGVCKYVFSFHRLKTTGIQWFVWPITHTSPYNLP